MLAFSILASPSIQEAYQILATLPPKTGRWRVRRLRTSVSTCPITSAQMNKQQNRTLGRTIPISQPGRNHDCPTNQSLNTSRQTGLFLLSETIYVFLFFFLQRRVSGRCPPRGLLFVDLVVHEGVVSSLARSEGVQAKRRITWKR